MSSHVIIVVDTGRVVIKDDRYKEHLPSFFGYNPDELTFRDQLGNTFTLDDVRRGLRMASSAKKFYGVEKK